MRTLTDCGTPHVLVAWANCRCLGASRSSELHSSAARLNSGACCCRHRCYACCNCKLPGAQSRQLDGKSAEGLACGSRRCAQAACGGSGKAVGCAGPLCQLLRLLLLLLMRWLLILLLLLLLSLLLLLLLELLRVLLVRLKGCKPWS